MRKRVQEGNAQKLTNSNIWMHLLQKGRRPHLYLVFTFAGCTNLGHTKNSGICN